MVQLAAVAILGAVLANDPAGRDRRIVNGEDADEGDWPWFVSLRQSNAGGSHYCGGTLIKGDVVVTAAHCVRYEGITDRPGAIRVNVGSYRLSDPNSGQPMRVSRVIVHPNYNENTMRNDIAILKLTSCAAGVAPIMWDTRSESELFANGAEAVGLAAIIGHGSDGTSDEVIDILQEAEQRVMTHSQCRSVFQREAQEGSAIHAASMICGDTNRVGGGSRVDTCQGDSGGPFVTKHNRNTLLTGITSWGFDCASTTPGVYTRVASYAAWIATNSRSSCRNTPTNPPSTSPPSTPRPTSPPSTRFPTIWRPTSPPSTKSPTTRRPTSPPSPRAPTTDSTRSCPTGYVDVNYRTSWPRQFNAITNSPAECADECAAIRGCTSFRWHRRKHRCQVFTGQMNAGTNANWINCVPDNTVTSSTSTSTTTTSTSTTTTDANDLPRSENSCSDLGWPMAPWNDRICGESNAGWNCKLDAHFEEAETTCAAVGARVCSEDELLDRAGWSTGCGLNRLPNWSGTRCTTASGRVGQVTVNRFSSACTLSTNTAGIRCCADVSEVPRGIALLSENTDSSYLGSEDNYYETVEEPNRLSRPRPVGAGNHTQHVSNINSTAPADQLDLMAADRDTQPEGSSGTNGNSLLVGVTIVGVILLFSIAAIVARLRLKRTPDIFQKVHVESKLEHEVHPAVLDTTSFAAINSVQQECNPMYNELVTENPAWVM